MIHSLIAEISGTQVLTGGAVAGGLVLIKTFFDIRGQYDESRDRKVMRDQVVTQTTVLKSIHEEQVLARTAQADMSGRLAIAMERQAKVGESVERIELAVTELRVASGLAVSPKKEAA